MIFEDGFEGELVSESGKPVQASVARCGCEQCGGSEEFSTVYTAPAHTQFFCCTPAEESPHPGKSPTSPATKQAWPSQTKESLLRSPYMYGIYRKGG